jgi:hypothetical protein
MPLHRQTIVRRIVAVVALLVISACAAPISLPVLTPSSSPMPLASGDIALPTEAPIPLEPGVATACAGVGLGAVLHGDASDPRVAWLVDTSHGTRIDVVWPPGYRARFIPAIEILDASEVVVLKAGDAVTGGCGTADPGILLVEPPFD